METDEYYPNAVGEYSSDNEVDGAADNRMEAEEVEVGAAGDVQSEVLKGCLEKFGSPDFIMEPEIFSQLKKYFQSGGNPEQVTYNDEKMMTAKSLAVY